MKLIFKVWPALRVKNLQLYLAGQVPSLCGTLMQNAAQNWLVYQITNSAEWLGWNGLLCYIPSVIFAPFGGIIVERWNIRKMLIATQCAAMMLAFTLGVIVLRHQQSLFTVNLFAALLGIVNAVDAPARYAFVAEIVHKEELHTANALNSTFYNLSVAVGPAAAGLLIPFVGIGWTFILNGISFWGVIWALCIIHPQHLSKKCDDHPLRAIANGARFVFTDRRIRSFLFLLGTTLVLGYSFRTILSAVSREVYHSGPGVMGSLSAAAALGAMFGAGIISMQKSIVRDAEKFIIGGCLILGVSLIAFSRTHELRWGLCELFFSGVGMMFNWSVIQPTLINLGGVTMRGRMGSWITMTMYSGLAFGSFVNGQLAARMGSSANAIAVSGLTAFVLAAAVFMWRAQLRVPLRQEA